MAPMHADDLRLAVKIQRLAASQVNPALDLWLTQRRKAGEVSEQARGPRLGRHREHPVSVFLWSFSTGGDLSRGSVSGLRRPQAVELGIEFAVLRACAITEN
jgi:hypothetical protein